MHEEIVSSWPVGKNLTVLKHHCDKGETDNFVDSNPDFEDNEQQICNEDRRKSEFAELRRDYTSHVLRLCNKNGETQKTATIY